MATQPASPRQPIEDIQAVLGRFSAWTDKHTGRQQPRGVRELSYDEALARGRRRSRPQEPGESPAKPAPKAAPAITAKKVPTARESKHAAVAPVAEKSAAPKQKTTPKRRPLASPAPTPKPRFQDLMTREALAQQVPTVTAQRVERETEQVSLLVRMSAAEREVLRLRAAEMGVSPPTYLRQCALDLETLREQIFARLATLERTQVTAPRTGWFTRLRLRLFALTPNRFVLRA